MRLIIPLVYFFSVSVFSCGEPTSKPFAPFAVLLNDSSGEEMNTYELNFPIKDAKEIDFFLRSIRAKVHSLFELNVRYNELKKYEGDFYTAYLTINMSLEGKTNIVADYNGGDKEGTSSYLCGNFKEYELAKLLEVKIPGKRAKAKAVRNPSPPTKTKS